MLHHLHNQLLFSTRLSALWRISLISRGNQKKEFNFLYHFPPSLSGQKPFFCPPRQFELGLMPCDALGAKLGVTSMARISIHTRVSGQQCPHRARGIRDIPWTCSGHTEVVRCTCITLAYASLLDPPAWLT